MNVDSTGLKYIYHKKTDSQILEDDKSQLAQGTRSLEFYNFKKGLYFIEVGAFDGVKYSNTHILEKKYNWKGICIEPNPKYYDLLKKSRDCICIDSAVFDEEDKEVEFTSTHHGYLSGITDCFNNALEARKDRGTVIMVLTKTLTRILDENSAPKYIDYISIDTEGSEVNVLNGIDFKKYKFGYIDIEHNYIKKCREEIKEILESNGYKFYRTEKFDDTYISEKLFSEISK